MNFRSQGNSEPNSSPSLRADLIESFEPIWQVALEDARYAYPSGQFPDVWPFSREIEAKIVGFGQHVQVESYLGDPLEGSADLARRLAAVPGVAHVEPAVVDFSLLRGRPETGQPGVDGVLLWGTTEGGQTFVAEDTWEYPVAPGYEPSVDLLPLEDFQGPDVDLSSLGTALPQALALLAEVGMV